MPELVPGSNFVLINPTEWGAPSGHHHSPETIRRVGENVTKAANAVGARVMSFAEVEVNLPGSIGLSNQETWFMAVVEVVGRR